MLAMSNANAIRSLARATGVARRAAPLFPIQISRASARHYAKHASLPANLREDNPSFVLHAVEKTSFDQVGLCHSIRSMSNPRFSDPFLP
jgi:hypothetical protein